MNGTSFSHQGSPADGCRSAVGRPILSHVHLDLHGIVRFTTGTGRKGRPAFDMEKKLDGDEGDNFTLDLDEE